MTFKLCIHKNQIRLPFFGLTLQFAARLSNRHSLHFSLARLIGFLVIRIRWIKDGRLEAPLRLHLPHMIKGGKLYSFGNSLFADLVQTQEVENLAQLAARICRRSS